MRLIRLPVRDAANHFSALIIPNLCKDHDVHAEPRHGDGGVYGASAGIGRHLFSFRLATLLQQ